MPTELPASVKFTTVWLLLGLAMFLAFQAWQRDRQASQFSATGGVIEIRRGADGHYHWPGTVNGQPIEFIVDTGATGSAIPASLARELGLPSLGALTSNTAGGVVRGSIVVADLALHGGLRIERMRLSALPALGTPLLGMDVLGRLGLEQRAGVLRIDTAAAR